MIAENLLERLKRKRKFEPVEPFQGEMRTAEPGILDRIQDVVSKAFPDTREGMDKARWLTQGGYETAKGLPVIGQALGAKELGEAGAREYLSRGYDVPWDTIKGAATTGLLGKAMFLGPKARGFNKAKARPGAGGHLWNELSDVPSKYIKPHPDNTFKIKKLPEVLEHPKLYEAYPHLKKVDVVHSQFLGDGAGINFETDRPLIGIGVKGRDFRGRLLHEVQHAIQRHENTPKGASPKETRKGKIFKKDWDQYWRSAGEVQARNVERRLSRHYKRMSPDESQDVPYKEQIIEYYPDRPRPKPKWPE